jgi:hypothetical protein
MNGSLSPAVGAGAIVFDLEPRYAGKSYPLPDVRTEDLRFYSIEQKYSTPRTRHTRHAARTRARHTCGTHARFCDDSVADVVSFISNKSALLPNNVRTPHTPSRGMNGMFSNSVDGMLTSTFRQSCGRLWAS